MYLKRQQLIDLGPDAERVIAELVHVRRHRWPDGIERLHELLQACDDADLRSAFKRATREPPVSVSAVARDVRGSGSEKGIGSTPRSKRPASLKPSGNPLGRPVKLSETPTTVERGAPRLGRHTEEVLAEHGFGVDEIAELMHTGAVRD